MKADPALEDACSKPWALIKKLKGEVGAKAAMNAMIGVKATLETCSNALTCCQDIKLSIERKNVQMQKGPASQAA